MPSKMARLVKFIRSLKIKKIHLERCNNNAFVPLVRISSKTEIPTSLGDYELLGGNLSIDNDDFGNVDDKKTWKEVRKKLLSEIESIEKMDKPTPKEKRAERTLKSIKTLIRKSGFRPKELGIIFEEPFE